MQESSRLLLIFDVIIHADFPTDKHILQNVLSYVQNAVAIAESEQEME